MSTQMDEGYIRWDDQWILNEYKNNKFMVIDPLRLMLMLPHIDFIALSLI